MENVGQLEWLLMAQKSLNDFVEKERGLKLPLDVWLDKLSTAIIHEGVELQRETNWKWWKNAKELDIEAIKEEAIDILHFLLIVFLKLGMNADDILLQYKMKNTENLNRQLGFGEMGYALKDKEIKVG